MNLKEVGELNLLTALLWGEARGEPLEGKIGVAWVVRNRENKPGWWGVGYTNVMLKPQQFSCFNLGDPNYHGLLLRILPSRNANMQDPVYRECRWVAHGVLGNWVPDPTGEANHYHAWEITPYWAKGQRPTTRIGNHFFYKL